MIHPLRRQSGVSLPLFAFIAVVLMIFAGLLIGLNGYYGSIQRLDSAGEASALAAAQDLCATKFTAGTYSIDRHQANVDVQALLAANMSGATTYPTQAWPAGDCSGSHAYSQPNTCPTLAPGPVGAVVFCISFPADSANYGSTVTVHMLWVIQQPFAGIVGPNNLNITSAQSAVMRISNPASGPSLVSYQDKILADSPAGFWPLDEASSACGNGAAAADASGNTNPGVYHNPTPSIVCGQAQPDASANIDIFGNLNSTNTALQETSNSDSSRVAVAFPHSNPLTGDHARSVEMWFADNNAGGINVLFEGGTLASGQAEQISIQRAGQLSASGDVAGAGVLVEFSSGANTGAAEVYIPTTSATDGNWHLLDVTLSGTMVTVYIDGAAAANGLVNTSGSFIANADASCGGRICTLPLTPNTTVSASGVQFGGADEPSVATYGFDGLLDEVAIYGVALSPQQVAQHYAGRG